MPSKKRKNNKTKQKNKRNRIIRKIKSRRNKRERNGGGDGDFEYIQNLDSQEMDILRKYTERHDLYSFLLRSNAKPLYVQMDSQEIFNIENKIEKLNELTKNITLIDNIMTNKAPVTTQDMTLYRGTKNDKDDAPYLGVNKAYISTSKTLNALEKNAFRFLDYECCVYKITIKKGVPYINLSKLSYFGDQHSENQEEILLPRGLKTTLESVSETDIQGDKYKTYNVIIELNDQDKYSVEPIENSQTVAEVRKLFEIILVLFDIAEYMNIMSNNPSLPEENRVKLQSILGEDDFDFYNVNMDTVNDILIQKYSTSITLVDYNNYLIRILKDMIKNKVLTVGIKKKLEGFMQKLKQYILPN